MQCMQRLLLRSLGREVAAVPSSRSVRPALTCHMPTGPNGVAFMSAPSRSRVGLQALSSPVKGWPWLLLLLLDDALAALGDGGCRNIGQVATTRRQQ
jgi:hypothetical protein